MVNSILSLLRPNTMTDGSRYYFSRLTNEQKGVYQLLSSGIRNHAKEIKMPMRPINEISKVLDCILLDNPMFFYAESSFKMSSDLYKQKCIVIPEYKYTRGETRAYTNEVMKCLRMFDSVKDKSEIEKELYVHDFCLSSFTYDYALGEHSHTVLGLVLNKSAVCEGIAKFVKAAFDYLGVSSLVVSGKANNPVIGLGMDGHAWNIVRIGGKTYHLDITFDMTIKDKILRYDYFNLPDDEIRKDHVIIVDVPACTTSGNDYYSVNSRSVNGLNGLDNYIANAMKRGERHMVVKIKNEPYSDDVPNKVMSIAQRQCIGNSAGITVIETSYNSSQMVFEIMYK